MFSVVTSKQNARKIASPLGRVLAWTVRPLWIVASGVVTVAAGALIDVAARLLTGESWPDSEWKFVVVGALVVLWRFLARAGGPFTSRIVAKLLGIDLGEVQKVVRGYMEAR